MFIKKIIKKYIRKKRIYERLIVWEVVVALCMPLYGNVAFIYARENEVEELDIVEVAQEEIMNISSKAAVLMEASTGTVLYEKEADVKLSPASITKIMTLIIIFDYLDEGKIKMDDIVTTSQYAKSMGGSQVFLEEGEQQSVETLIKCIVVASGNDASVAMAEYIAGSEGAFVNMMNERAQELGMINTNFEDCCGLTESENHYTTARDVAIMSRELTTKYPKIHDYSTIWMESITHKTKQGESEFVLTNTNKLLKMDSTVTGLKTGSTSIAKYCVSVTALRDDVEMIAVIMAAPDYKVRFSEAEALLNYGYANCKVYKDFVKEMEKAPVLCGKNDFVEVQQKEEFSYISTDGTSFENVTKEIKIDENIEAPVKKGDKVGEIIYYNDGEKLGTSDIVAKSETQKAGYFDIILKVLNLYFVFSD
ncbi:MAG: D-alanyl-D-alanine carboxypeptidase family protein [Eubacterium sp.]